jgi:glycosyltransferase involved in cell wall biosynthesis
MYKDKKIIVVMPAYNAARTLRKTWDEVMAQETVDMVILVDDGSQDKTVSIAKELPNTLVHIHEKNLGYGGNQKTCYRLALESDRRGELPDKIFSGSFVHQPIPKHQVWFWMSFYGTTVSFNIDEDYII